MSSPIIVNLKGNLVNLSQAVSIFTSNDVLTVAYLPTTTVTIKFDTAAEAGSALTELEKLLAEKNLYIGKVG